MKIKHLSPLASVFGAVLLSTSAQAVPISGVIDIVAFGSEVQIDKTANTLTFVDLNMIAGNAVVSNGTGDFSGLFGSAATYSDFTYSPLGGGTNPVWITLGGPPTAQFSLFSITSIDETGVGLILTGTGTINLTGFDATAGTWSFSADQALGSAQFTFSSQTAARTPDGGTSIALLGFSLLGLVGARRKFAKA